MVDVKTAVGAAEKAAKELYAGKKLAGLELEEVDRTEDGQYWLITLGFDVPAQRHPSTMEKLLDPVAGTSRKYKIFKIDAEDGTFKNMLIREP